MMFDTSKHLPKTEKDNSLKTMHGAVLRSHTYVVFLIEFCC